MRRIEGGKGEGKGGDVKYGGGEKEKEEKRSKVEGRRKGGEEKMGGGRGDR